tara:strand:- start:86 stop:406 length:321 start_codon:yes stop_codon:yes gene_type:complete
MNKILTLVILASFILAGKSTATYSVEGMMCAMNCPKKINKALEGVDGVKSCKVDFASHTATVVFNDEKLSSEIIAETIAKGTYYKVEDMNEKKGSSSFWNWLFGKE